MKVVAFLLGLVNLIITGLFLKLFWGWFIASQFHVQMINWSQALGLAFFVSLISSWKSYSQRELEELTDDDGATQLINQILRLRVLIIMFLEGWVLHYFWMS